MTAHFSKLCTAFDGTRRLSSGPLIEVALAVKNATEAAGPVLIFDDATGAVVDLDLRGTNADLIDRLARSSSTGSIESKPRPAPAPPGGTAGEPRGRGRPALGVVAREVTLLPRHWEWLAAQPGGASVALRKLVEDARRTGGTSQQTRAARERAYRFMAAMAGDMPGFEEATRALFADDCSRFEQHVMGWPDDVRAYATGLAFDGGPRQAA
jgi:hypothetical protein